MFLLDLHPCIKFSSCLTYLLHLPLGRSLHFLCHSPQQPQNLFTHFLRCAVARLPSYVFYLLASSSGCLLFLRNAPSCLCLHAQPFPPMPFPSIFSAPLVSLDSPHLILGREVGMSSAIVLCSSRPLIDFLFDPSLKKLLQSLLTVSLLRNTRFLPQCILTHRPRAPSPSDSGSGPAWRSTAWSLLTRLALQSSFVPSSSTFSHLLAQDALLASVIRRLSTSLHAFRQST